MANGDLTLNYFVSVFRQYGLENIADEINAALEEGEDSNEQILERVRNTEEYNKIFPGITERARKGLPAITEGQYLELRNQYKRTLEAYNLNIEDVAVNKSGESLSENEAFGSLIANDISAVEFSERLEIANQWTASADPQTKEALRRFYGLEDKDLMAYALSPGEGGQALLRRRAAGIEVASQALRSGFDIYSTSAIRPDDALGREYLQELATRGLTPEASLAEMQQQTRIAGEAVARAGEQQATFSRLADIEGVDLTAEEQVEAQMTTTTGRVAASRQPRAKGKVERLRSQERARFGGTSGGTNIFGNNESGSF